MKSYVFYFPNRNGVIVVAPSLTDAISKLSSDELCEVIKIEVPPFEVL